MKQGNNYKLDQHNYYSNYKHEQRNPVHTIHQLYIGIAYSIRVAFL